MDALRIAAIGSTALGALKPIEPPATVGQAAVGPASETLISNDLATTILAPAPQDGGRADQTASLLAALAAPQAPVDTTPPPEAARPDPPQDTFRPQAEATDTAPAARAALATAQPRTIPVATGADLAFALETALRFGAGVAPLGSPLVQTPNLDGGLVRDAAAVFRQPSLQPQAGGPGPGAFTHPQVLARRALHGYQAAPPEPPAGQLDLLA